MTDPLRVQSRVPMVHLPAEDTRVDDAASHEALRAFARNVLAGYLGQGEIGDIDGATIQEWAVACSLLRPVEVTESCGDYCGCAEGADFPAICYKPTSALSPAAVAIDPVGELAELTTDHARQDTPDRSSSPRAAGAQDEDYLRGRTNGLRDAANAMRKVLEPTALAELVAALTEALDFEQLSLPAAPDPEDR